MIASYKLTKQPIFSGQQREEHPKALVHGMFEIIIIAKIIIAVAIIIIMFMMKSLSCLCLLTE